MEAGLPRADLLLINARVYTMDPYWPWASEIAIAGERILALGEDVRYTAAPGCRVVDLEGYTVLPGLADSHVHFLSYALRRRSADLSAARSLEEMLARAAEWAARSPAPEWVVGHGWDQEQWPEPRFPSAADLDRVFPDRPAVLFAKSGHALVANTLAMRLAGLSAATPDPPGGHVGRDAAGQPSGLFCEEPAMQLVTRALPAPSAAEVDEALRAAFPAAWRLGLTALHEMDGAAAYAAYQRLQMLGPLGLRVTLYLPPTMLDEAAQGRRAPPNENWLRIGGIKLFADGALGTRTAALFEPYADGTGNCGLLTLDEEALERHVREACARGLPVAVHAIGDRANHVVLNVLERVGPPRGEAAAPHRIEHVQLLHPHDLPRLAALGVVASMQPLHATQDRPLAERYWGPRCATAYAWRSLLEAGTVLAFGSDAPVESLDPFLGLYAAVTRRSLDGAPGPEGWYPQQCLSVLEALAAYTRGAACAAGVEDRTGSLGPGKLADLIVLDRDVTRCPPEEIPRTKVLATMIGGAWVHGPF